MLSSKIEKRESEISGTGLFAKEKITKDEVIWWPTSDTMDKMHVTNLEKLSEEKRAHWIKNAYQMDTYLYLDTDDTTYMNHSCNPNVVDSVDESLLIAKRDIEKDEEVTWNYLPFMNQYLTFQCFCNNKNCVGVVKKGVVAKIIP